ncbi:MAG: hypothetical protein ACXV8O_01575 [Methylobacter sp.]
MNPIPPRPKRADPEVLAIFYSRFAAEMHKQCPELCRGTSLEEIESELRAAGRPECDGYEYAKKLENAGWSRITASDVEVLDSAFSVLSDAHDTVVGKWVKDNDIKPPCPDGDTAFYKGVAGTVHYDGRLIPLGQCLFRSKEWVEEHGDKGGLHVYWENIECLPF